MSAAWMTAEEEGSVATQVARFAPRLRRFVRARVDDAAEAEDILQDVFFELVEAHRLPAPIEDVAAWLYRVARNRIVDAFRRKRTVALEDLGDDEGASLEVLLPAPDAGPEAAFARAVMVEELEAALAELPAEQRDVFLAHEIGGESFKEIAARTGVGINTLLGRKRYAVLHLRRRLRAIHDEFIENGG